MVEYEPKLKCDMVKDDDSLVKEEKNPIFLLHFFITLKCFMLMLTPLKLDLVTELQRICQC